MAYSFWRHPKNSLFKAFGLDNPAENKIPLYAMFLLGWLQLVAWESGWVAAETGRQPFVIWGPMTQTTSGLYSIQYVMLTAEGFNNSPEVLPIGISIMIVLAIAVAGTLYMLKKLFSGKEVSADVSSARLIMAANTGGTSPLNIKRK